MKKQIDVQGSFRDPSGHLYIKGGVLYRQIDKCYKKNYDLLLRSGLYEGLVNNRSLIEHEEEDLSTRTNPNLYKLIKPQKVPFISYPYEWTFSQLKDAALTTLEIQKVALTYGMTLKDASAYNIQFYKGRPILIDTLSFEKYVSGEPWVAYKQFCQHFIAPLALMSYKDTAFGQLLRIHIDGIPLQLASKLLPTASYLNTGVLVHVHLHAKSQKLFSNTSVGKSMNTYGIKSMQGLIDSLKSTVSRLKCKKSKTTWADYYDETNYENESMSQKEKLLDYYLKRVEPKVVWDLGSNTGKFSRISAKHASLVVAIDNDTLAVERNYVSLKTDNIENVLPLFVDMNNPSPSIGWSNSERYSLIERGPSDCVLALALIHHLCISNNVPFGYLARFLSKIGKWAIVEFVPKSDSKVKLLLRSRKDIFENYKQEMFEKDFLEYFRIIDKRKIKHTKRTLYLMKKR